MALLPECPIPPSATFKLLQLANIYESGEFFSHSREMMDEKRKDGIRK
jgi:hypothetical protein